jgi:L-alanine-DL-glutamate epimerase-like enolase superfamily enzyme
MKITDMSISVHGWTPPQTVGFPKEGKMGVLTIETDEGISGHNFLYDQDAVSPGVEALARQIVRLVKPRLLGRNPLDIGAIWNELRSMSRSLHPAVQGYVDVTLWDIAGKAAGLPVHRLLGTCREEMPVYASSWALPDTQAYIEEALAYREVGIRAYKVHPPSFSAFFTGAPSRGIDADIAACAAIREAVTNQMTLMFDGAWRYTYPEALKVGLALQELGYYWYEDPLKSDDIFGYIRLKEKLSIPLMATETTEGGLYAYPAWLVLKATDFLRGDVVIKGGITGMMKIAHLAEAFGLNCELHDAYTPTNQVASLNVAMAISNCEYYEVLVPNDPGKYGFGFLSYGLEEPFRVDNRGHVHAPTLPGIGCRIDWPLMESTRLGVISTG